MKDTLCCKPQSLQIVNQGSCTHEFAEMLTVNISHRVVQMVIIQESEVENWYYVWMLQAGCDDCFPNELLNMGLTIEKALQHYFQGHKPPRHVLLDEQDFSHASTICERGRAGAG